MEYPLTIRSVWSTVSSKACIFLLIFCLDDLSVGVNGMLKSPTIIVLLLMSPFMAVTQWAHSVQFSSVQSLSRVRLFATPWTAARQPPCPSPTPRACSNSYPLIW